MNFNSVISGIRDSVQSHYRIISSQRAAQIGAIILICFIFIGIFSPWLAPHHPEEIHRAEDGSVDRFAAPSQDHLFGTTNMGRDVFSQTLISTRVSIIVGLVAALIGVTIGATIGIISGFYGGWIDDFLMRVTDIAWSLPFIPFVFILVLFMGASLMNITLALALIIWRSTARVVRSQVLSVRERPYIEAAKATGTSNSKIMYKHIFPNVLPIIFLYGTFAIAGSILAEAGISFLGMGDPDRYSWGRMIFLAYSSNSIQYAWWWAFFPGISISILVISIFQISRAYEQIANPDLDEVV